MWEHVNCSRFIWNWGLDFQKKRYEEFGDKLSGYDLVKQLTPLKKQEEYQWLKSVSNKMLTTTLLDLDKAYNNFFKSGFGFPKFKSKKKSRKSFPIRNTLYFTESEVFIEKLKKIPYQTNYQIPLGKDVKFYNPRIHYTPNSKWILTVSIKCENQASELTDIPMGIDLGVKELATVAFGEDKLTFKNINKTREMKKLEKKLRRVQRQISRKYEMNKQDNKFVKTQNIIRLEDEVRKLQYHMSNIRQNYIHQTTHKLINLKPCRITVEDLNISGMMKNKHLSKAIQQQNFYEFIRQLEYKCSWNGIELMKADRFYPSSKTCSNCGCIKSDLKLSDRTYICPDCGIVIDRDYNAAINLMKYAN